MTHRALRPTLGDRVDLRRTQEPPTRPTGHPALTNPEGVYQEAWGYLCVHYALRALIHDAADRGDLDPDRISFTKILHAARSVRTGLSGTVNLAAALQRAISEILHPLLPERRLRANARVIRRKMSNYNLKRATHRTWPTPTPPIGSAIRILSPP